MADFPTTPQYRDAVHWMLVDQHLAIGGVRIEVAVLVTDGAPVSLSGEIPRTL